MNKTVIRRIIAVVTVISTALCLFSSCGKTVKYADGDIENSGFESSLKDYWSISDKTAASLDSTLAESGEYSLRLGSDNAYEVSAVQHIKGLTPGYYYLEASTVNEGNQSYCYIYGNGTNQGKCMTSVPRTIHEDTWTTVTVRGICVEADGMLEIGICSAGEGQYVNIDSLSLKYETNQDTPYESLFGGAISWLDWVEDLGGKYYRADGSEADALQIMAENGCNIVRLELYNNPGDYINEYGDMFPSGYKDADAIFDLALRAHSKGMKIQLSFMYSDYWGNDIVPCDWLEKIDGIEDEQEITEILTDCIYGFTSDFMKRLAAEGIYPEYVSLGNEMQGGILQPYSCTWTTDAAMDAFCAFMDAGYRAVKEVSPSSKIVLHSSCNADDMFWESRKGTGVWFYGLCEEYDVKYDVIGISYYPYWAQTEDKNAVKNALDTGDLVEWCNMMIDRFDKDILIMESGINWGTPGQLADNGAYKGIYSCSPEGQRDFMYELINAIKSVKDGRCVGDLYWDPVLVKQEGVGWAIRSATNTARENCVETTTFFDYDHVALPVLNAYLYNTAGDSTAVIYGTASNPDGTAAVLCDVTFEFNGKSYAVTTDKYGDYIACVSSGTGTLCGQEITLSPGERARVDITNAK